MFIYLNNILFHYTITIYHINLFSLTKYHQRSPVTCLERRIMRTSLADRKTDTTLFEQYVERPVSVYTLVTDMCSLLSSDEQSQ